MVPDVEYNRWNDFWGGMWVLFSIFKCDELEGHPGRSAQQKSGKKAKIWFSLQLTRIHPQVPDEQLGVSDEGGLSYISIIFELSFQHSFFLLSFLKMLRSTFRKLVFFILSQALWMGQPTLYSGDRLSELKLTTTFISDSLGLVFLIRMLWAASNRTSE